MTTTSATTSTPAATATLGTSTAPKATAKGAQQVDYLKLIVAQMRNMNPMDSASGQDSLPTMMAAENLNQLTQLNQAIKDLQTLTQTSYASSIAGRTVEGLDAGGNKVSGVVKAIHMDAGGPMLELADGKRLRLLDITRVATA